MLTLGVETSCKAGSVALSDGGCLRETRTLSHAGRRHAQALVKEIDEMLAVNNCDSRDVELIAVSIGPGSFTGLRVGVVFAKTWCYATGAKLAAVDSLHAAAEGAPAEIETVQAIADAQRGELYVGQYARTDKDGQSRIQVGTIDVVNADEFANNRNKADFITGPALERYESNFKDRCGSADAEQRNPHAVAVARIGLRLALGGQCADVWTLEPCYIRKSSAEEKRERQN